MTRQPITLTVNGRAETVLAEPRTHLGDFLREDQRLGTAGALSLLPEAPTQPIVVTNADLLT